MPTGPLERLQQSVDALTGAIVGTLERPGLVHQVEKHGRDIEDHTGRIKALEMAPGRKALDLWTMVGMLMAGAAITAITTIVTANFRPAAHHQTTQGGPAR